MHGAAGCRASETVPRRGATWSELPAGWYDLAQRRCLDLEALLGDRALRWTARQSKEKLASWRFFWRLEGVEEPYGADVLGTVVPEADVGTSRLAVKRCDRSHAPGD